MFNSSIFSEVAKVESSISCFVDAATSRMNAAVEYAKVQGQHIAVSIISQYPALGECATLKILNDLGDEAVRSDANPALRIVHATAVQLITKHFAEIA